MWPDLVGSGFFGLWQTFEGHQIGKMIQILLGKLESDVHQQDCCEEFTRYLLVKVFAKSWTLALKQVP